jgi:hypothetical protein
VRLSDFLDDIGRTVAYYPELALCFGSVNAAILLSQLFYWDGKQNDQVEGWIFKTQKEITKETGLSRRESDTARRVLRDKKIITDKLRGVPPKIHFLIHRKALDDLWDEWRKAPNQDGGKRQIDLAQSAETDCPNPPNLDGAKRQDIKIPENTSEITRDDTHTRPAPPEERAQSEESSVCVLPELTFEDFRAFARSKPSFTDPDAWALKHFNARDEASAALVREWKEKTSPERIAETRAALPDDLMPYSQAGQIVNTMMEAHGRDPLDVIDELEVSADVRARLIERFSPPKEEQS